MSKFTDPVPVVRPALPSDKADVFEFTKFIWGGHDYVGYVFPEWLEDPHGQLLVVEYAGKCIGTGKVTYLAPGQWWLEGFRIDPNFQGLKIGSQLDAANNEWWDAHGDGVLRLMTSAKRVQVHHLSELRGFAKLGDIYGYEAEPLDEPADMFTPLAPDEVSEAVSIFRLHAPARLINLGWRFASPNTDSLRSLAERGLAWRWRGGRGFVTAWENDEEDVPNLVVGLEACAQDDRAGLLEDFRRLVFARGAVVAGWMNAINEAVIQDLESAGFKRAWQDAGFLYERRHS